MKGRKYESRAVMMPGVRFLAILALFFVPVSLSAQSRGASSSGLKVRFLVFGRIVGPETLLLVDPKSPEKSREVALHLNNFTGPYRATSRNVVLAAPGSGGGDAPAAAMAKLVARVSVPASLGSRVLLVLVPKGGKKGGYRVLPMSDDRVGFAPGERRFVNLTPYSLAGKFDGRSVFIKAGGVVSLKLRKPPGGRDNHEVVIYFRAKDKEPWKPLTSTVWPYDPEARSLVFFYWNAGEKRIRIQSIAEIPPAGKTDAAKTE